MSKYKLIPKQVQTFRCKITCKVFESFAIAGTDGTLKDRMKELGMRIRGKTGALASVSALCGYATLPDDLVAFSILVNGFVANSLYNPPCKTEVEDAFCSQLVGQPA